MNAVLHQFYLNTHADLPPAFARCLAAALGHGRSVHAHFCMRLQKPDISNNPAEVQRQGESAKAAMEAAKTPGGYNPPGRDVEQGTTPFVDRKGSVAKGNPPGAVVDMDPSTKKYPVPDVKNAQ